MSIGGLPEIFAAIKALTARVTTLEQQVAALGTTVGAHSTALADVTAQLNRALADFARFSDQVNAARTDLETRSTEAFAKVAQNTRAIQAIFTLLHPDTDHPIVTDDVIPNGVWLHDLVMHWIETYGRLTPGEAAE